jgi:predicted nucleic acid-binding protein
VLLAGVAGFRNVGHNASASLLKLRVSDNTFTWLISGQILDEYKEALARQKVRGELTGRIINLLRGEGSLVHVKRPETVSPDPGDDPICACAEEGDAGFIVTLNPRDFPQRKLEAAGLIAVMHHRCSSGRIAHRLWRPHK